MSGDGVTTIWLMDSDFCDKCGAYLYPDGRCDDNSGLCSFCFDQWLSEETGEDYDPEDWYNPDEAIGTLEYGYDEQRHGLPPMPAPRKKHD